MKSFESNVDIPDGYKLIKEVEKRFGTTHDVVESFMKTAPMLEKMDSDRIQTALSSLKTIRENDGSTYYPALDEIAKVFSSVLKLQTQLEASLEPTSSQFILLLELLKND